MVARSCAISSSSRSRPRRVSVESRMSTISVAWISLNPNASPCRVVMAAPRSSEARMAAMISSIRSSARRKPSTMCARRSALASRNRDRRVMTSIWCSM